MNERNTLAFFNKDRIFTTRSYVIDACYCLLPAAVFLPTRTFNQVLILFSLMLFIRPSDIRLRFGLRPVLILLMPLFLHLFAFLVDIVQGYAGESWSRLEPHLAIFALAFLIHHTYSDRRFRLALVAFVASVSCAITVCLAIAFYRNYAFHNEIVYNWDFQGTMDFYARFPIGLINWGYFTYSALAMAINFHPVYLSVYVLTAGIIVVYWFLLAQTVGRKIFLSALLLYFVLFILMLGTKMPIFAALFLVLLFIVKEAAGTHDKKRRIAYAIAFCAAIGSAVLIPSMRYRVEHLVHTAVGFINAHKNYSGSIDEMKEMHRIYLWKTAITAGEQKPWTGHGLWGGRRVMEKAFEADGNPYFNSHNEYINHFVIAGIIGALLFTVYIIYLMVFSFKIHDYLYFAFVVLIALTAVTENFLSRNKGVVLFAFLNALFVHRYFYQKKEHVKI